MKKPNKKKLYISSPHWCDKLHATTQYLYKTKKLNGEKVICPYCFEESEICLKRSRYEKCK